MCLQPLWELFLGIDFNISLPFILEDFIKIKLNSSRHMDSGDQSYVKPQPKKYQRISGKTKKKLIQMVKNGTKILSAAKVLKIKDSTAKMIIKKHRERGDMVEEAPQMDQNISEQIEKINIKETEQQKAPQNQIPNFYFLPYCYPYMGGPYMFGQFPKK